VQQLAEYSHKHKCNSQDCSSSHAHSSSGSDDSLRDSAPAAAAGTQSAYVAAGGLTIRAH
jgi:hypothetical protein